MCSSWKIFNKKVPKPSQEMDSAQYKRIFRLCSLCINRYLITLAVLVVPSL